MTRPCSTIRKATDALYRARAEELAKRLERDADTARAPAPKVRSVEQVVREVQIDA